MNKNKTLRQSIDAGLISALLLTLSLLSTNAYAMRSNIELCKAAYNNDLTQVGELIAGGADVNESDRKSKNALYYASECAHVDMVKLLISKGANHNLRPRHINKEIKNFWTEHLINAVIKGSLEQTQAWIDIGGAIDERVNSPYPPLHEAIRGGHLEIAKLLIDSGADIENESFNGPPLVLAVKRGQVAIAKLLLSHGASLDSKDEDGFNPLAIAHKNNNHKMIDALQLREDAASDEEEDGDDEKQESIIEHEDNEDIDIDVDAPRLPLPPQNNWTAGSLARGAAVLTLGTGALALAGKMVLDLSKSWSYKRQLSFAIANKDVAGVIALFAQALEIDAQKININHALHLAIACNNSRAVSLFIANGAKVNIADASGETPLHKAAFKGHAKVTRILVAAGADKSAKNKDGEIALHLAAKNGDPDTLKAVLGGSDILLKAGRDKSTALHNAIWHGNVKVARLLLEAGSDINATNTYGFTPLICATYRGHVEMVKFLLASGADASLATHQERSALYFAITKNYYTIRDILVKATGHDIEETLKKGRRAYGKTAKVTKAELLKMMVSGDVNKTYSDKRRALHYACENGLIMEAKALIAAGASIDQSDAENKTALHLATLNGHIKLVELLLNSGADHSKRDLYVDTALDMTIKYHCANAGFSTRIRMAQMIVERMPKIDSKLVHSLEHEGFIYKSGMRYLWQHDGSVLNHMKISSKL